MEMYHLRARAALALAAKSPADRKRLLDSARSDAKMLGKQDAPWAEPTRDIVLAAISMLKGDRDTAIEKLQASMLGFDACQMQLHAAAARRRLGELVGGERGRSLREVADNFMKRETLLRPERWTELWAPGFAKPEELPVSLAITMMQ
jgi:hypothetical protein